MVFSLDVRRIKQESYRVIRQDGLSGILISVGLVQLHRFLQKYPEPVKEVSDDN